MTSIVKRVWKWIAGLFAVAAILLALLVGLFRIVVTHAPDYRQPIAEWASRTLGLPVAIGQVDARLGIYGPELIFRDATILAAPGGDPLFSAGRGSVSLDVTELLFGWRVKADQFTLDGLQLEIDRSREGEILVFGRPLSDFRGGGGLPVEEIRIEGARLVIRDRMEGGRVWVLDDVETRLTKVADGLRIDGRFTPPAEAADDLTFWLASEGADGWSTYVGARGFNLAMLDQIPGLPLPATAQGRGDVRLWVDTESARLTRITAELDMSDVRSPALGGADEAAEDPVFAAIRGRIEWDLRPAGWRARIGDLVVAREGPEWRADEIMVEHSVAASGAREQLIVDADFLRLDDLAYLAPAIPDEELRGMLMAVRPRGDVTALSVAVSTAVTDVRTSQVEFRADVDRLTTRPYGKFPGVSGLSGTVRSDSRGGRVEFDGRNTTIEFAELFRDPLRFDRLQGLVVWSRGADGLTIIGDDVRAGNPDLALQTGFRLRIPADGDEGRMDVQATVRDVDLSSAPRYLPVGIMRDTLVAWLDSAIVSGRTPMARMRLQGPFKGFPYPDDQGIFEVSFGAQDLVLDYAAGWPRGEAIAADFLFRNEGFSAKIREGNLSGIAVEDIAVEIPVLREGVLDIEGRAAGELADVRRYVLGSPLSGLLGPALADTRVERGQSAVFVDLLLPLKDLDARDVRVELDIEDARVLYGRIDDPLESAAGRLLIDMDRVWSEDLTGMFLGQPVEIAVVTPETGGTRMEVTGLVTDEALTGALEIPLDNYVDGIAPWQGTAYFPRKETDDEFWIRLETGLSGMASTLPYPLGKTAEEIRSLTVDFRFPEEGRSEWFARYNDQCSIAAGFDTSKETIEFHQGIVRCGAGAAVLPDEPGLFIEGSLDTLPVVEWLAVRFGDRREGSLDDLLKRIDLEVADAVFGGQHFGAVVAILQQAAPDWALTLEGDAVAGDVRIPMNFSTGRPIAAELARLKLDDDEADEGGERLDPRDVPSIDITVDDFHNSGLRLGSLSARIKSVPNGFYLEDFSLVGPEYTIDGSMRSVLGFGQDESSLSLLVKVADLGETMDFMGFTRSLESKDGEFSVDLTWTGGIPPDILAVAEGTASLRVKNGSMTDVKPGAGRVFGLLSVQALPRRLILDFRDVFKKGFFFDELKGDFRIKDGDAFTDNLILRSPAADIGIVGTVSLIDRVYDQTAIVSAEVGNTLPVVGAIAAGPAIGAGLFVLKEIFKESLRGVAQVQYRITGPWESPEVERIATAEEVPAEAPGTAVSDDPARENDRG